MPIRLKDDAIAELVARDERLRHPDGKPNHNEILRASGVSSTHWWNIRNGYKKPGADAFEKLMSLAESTGLTEDEAYALLFTTKPPTTTASAA